MPKARDYDDIKREEGLDAVRRAADTDPREPPPKPNGSAGPAVMPPRATPYIAPDPATIPPRGWLYGGHYLRTVVTATVAPGGFGKTSLSLYEALNMAIDGLAVWYISGEDDKDEIDRRISGHLIHHNVGLGNARFFVDDRRTFPLSLTIPARNSVLFNEQALAALEAAIIADNIDVIILDPFVSFHMLPESDAVSMDQLIKRLMVICQLHECNIELSHHVRKPGIGQIEITVDDARGSGAIVNAVRSCRVINRMSVAEAERAGVEDEQRAFHLRVDRGKANMAPPEKATWRRLVSVELPNGDNVQAIEPWSFPKPKIAGDADEEWIVIVVTERPYRTDSRSEEWLGYKMIKHFGLDIDNVRDIKWINKTLSQWVHKGILAKAMLEVSDQRKAKPHYVLGENAKITKQPTMVVNSEEME